MRHLKKVATAAIGMSLLLSSCKFQADSHAKEFGSDGSKGNPFCTLAGDWWLLLGPAAAAGPLFATAFSAFAIASDVVLENTVCKTPVNQATIGDIGQLIRSNVNDINLKNLKAKIWADAKAADEFKPHRDTICTLHDISYDLDTDVHSLEYFSTISTDFWAIGTAMRLANWQRIVQFAIDNKYPVATVQKYRDNYLSIIDGAIDTDTYKTLTQEAGIKAYLQKIQKSIDDAAKSNYFKDPELVMKDTGGNNVDAIWCVSPKPLSSSDRAYITNNYPDLSQAPPILALQLKLEKDGQICPDAGGNGDDDKAALQQILTTKIQSIDDALTTSIMNSSAVKALTDNMDQSRKNIKKLVSDYIASNPQTITPAECARPTSGTR